MARLGHPLLEVEDPWATEAVVQAPGGPTTDVDLVGAGLRADIVALLLEQAGWSVRPEGAEQPTAADLVVVVASGVPDIADVVRDSASGSAAVLVVTDQAGAPAIAALVAAGAASVVTEQADAGDVTDAARLTARGFGVVDPTFAGLAASQWRAALARADTGAEHGLDALTPREREVLAALAEGLTGKSVARRLFISLKTVEAHKANIFARLGVRTQSQAVAVAVRAGLPGAEAPSLADEPS